MAQAKSEIYVRTETGKKFQLDFTKDTTVGKLKSKIRSNKQADKNQSLYFGGELLSQNSRTLESYGITNGNTIYLQITTRAIEISAPDVTKQKSVRLGKNNYLYWKVAPGLNYAGTCHNKTCNAYQQKVMMHRGFDEEIDPDKDEHKKEIIKCPGCKTKFDLQAFYFFECNVEMSYKKQGDQTMTNFNRRVNGDVWKLGEEDQKVTYWYLEFNVRRLGKQ